MLGSWRSRAGSGRCPAVTGCRGERRTRYRKLAAQALAADPGRLRLHPGGRRGDHRPAPVRGASGRRQHPGRRPRGRHADVLLDAGQAAHRAGDAHRRGDRRACRHRPAQRGRPGELPVGSFRPPARRPAGRRGGRRRRLPGVGHSGGLRRRAAGPGRPGDEHLHLGQLAQPGGRITRRGLAAHPGRVPGDLVRGMYEPPRPRADAENRDRDYCRGMAEMDTAGNAGAGRDCRSPTG
jgi:hypothetical protein